MMSTFVHLVKVHCVSNLRSLMSSILTEGTVFDLVAYLPDSFIPQYEEIKETFVSLLKKLGIVRGDDSSSSKEHADLKELQLT